MVPSLRNPVFPSPLQLFSVSMMPSSGKIRSIDQSHNSRSAAAFCMMPCPNVPASARKPIRFSGVPGSDCSVRRLHKKAVVGQKRWPTDTGTVLPLGLRKIPSALWCFEAVVTHPVIPDDVGMIVPLYILQVAAGELPEQEPSGAYHRTLACIGCASFYLFWGLNFLPS